MTKHNMVEKTDGIGIFSVVVNGRKILSRSGESVEELIARLGFAGRGTAIARNSEILPRSSWKSTVVVDDDVFEVLAPQAGG
ncbi:MAG TPA: sulfur carrier protein ThiS [Acidimicrobiales bacterium]|nr:sulfur carrier protein ThiS [Acidimicrobiales bacterium]